MYIVTGGAGFIGSAFVWKLNAEGIEDIVVVDRLGATEKWKNLVNSRIANYLHKDYFLKMVWENKLPFKVKAIIHMGACSSTTERDADYLINNNYHYSCVLANWAVSNNVPFIYASSAATYGDGSEGFSDDDGMAARLRPINMYGYSKQLFDLWILKNNLGTKVTGLKFFNVFGPNEYHKGEMRSMVHKSFGQIKEEGRVRLFKSYRKEYGDGEQLRDFVYIKDCVEVLWWFLQNPSVTGIYNLGTGAARSWNDLAGAVFSAVGRKARIEYIEMPEDLRDQYQYFTEARIDKLRLAGCQVSFRTLEEAIHDYVVDYLKRPNPYL